MQWLRRCKCRQVLDCMASRWQGFIRQFLWTLPAGVAVHDMLGSVVRVDGLSMQPTLNAKGTSTPEWVLVEKFTVKWRHIYRRGDVYVFWCAATRCSRRCLLVVAAGRYRLATLGSDSLLPDCVA